MGSVMMTAQYSLNPETRANGVGGQAVFDKRELLPSPDSRAYSWTRRFLALKSVWKKGGDCQYIELDAEQPFNNREDET